MGWRATLALGGALLVAAAVLYHDVNAGRAERSWQAIFELPQKAPPVAQITPLVSFDPAAVTAIRVRRGSATWQSERTADGWSGGARPRELNDFLNDLTALAEIMPIPADPAALREHGLDPAEGSIELTRRDAPPLVIHIGKRNPPATGVYVQLGDGGPVALTGALLLWDLEKFTRAVGAGTR